MAMVVARRGGRCLTMAMTMASWRWHGAKAMMIASWLPQLLMVPDDAMPDAIDDARLDDAIDVVVK